MQKKNKQRRVDFKIIFILVNSLILLVITVFWAVQNRSLGRWIEQGNEFHLWERRFSSSASAQVCLAVLQPGFQAHDVWDPFLRFSEKQWQVQGWRDPLRLYVVSGSEHLDLKGRLPHLKNRLESLCRRWVLIGHEQGVRWALQLSIFWPQGVDRLLLLSTRDDGSLSSWLSQIQVPTLFLWGQKDTETPLEQGYRLREYLRSAIWREVHDGGHFLQKECPEKILQALVDLMRYGVF